MYCTENVFAFHRGSWDTSGVKINMTNQTIQCLSSHLTSFAVMVDVHGANQVHV